MAKQNYLKSWDFEDMLEEYGFKFLGNTDTDSVPLEMGMIDKIGFKPLDAIERAFHGGRFGFKKDSFNPNDDWFAFNEYGNFVSINDRDLLEYLEEKIDESDFFEWCLRQGYAEIEEE